MHTRDPYYETGSMMDAAEIPIKQYMQGGFANTSNQSRPAMGAGHRRSSSGVYSDDGLASAAAIAALYKQDPDVGAPHSAGFQQARNCAISPSVMPASDGTANLSSTGVEASSAQSGMPPSPPRQRLNVGGPATAISPDAGGFNFPKTLRRPAQTRPQETETPVRPVIPLSQRSLRPNRPVAQPGTTSTISSYIRLSKRQPLPTPSKVIQASVHMIPGPEATGPAGAKTMRRPSASELNSTDGGRGSAVNMPPPQGASAAGLMTDYGSSNTAPYPADIPATKTTTPSGAAHGCRPDNTSSLYTTEAQTLSSEKPINPYMPQPPPIENDLTEDFNNLAIGGEGAYVGAKTLRHPADAPKAQRGQPASAERVPLASKTLRRPSSSEGKTSIFQKLRGSSTRGGSGSNIGRQQSQSSTPRFDGGHDADTTVYETINPAVTHEHVTPVIHKLDDEVITRDIHNYDVYDRILPVKEHIELPPRHYTPDAAGKLVEIQSPVEEAGAAAGTPGAPPHISTPGQDERILVSETTITSPNGTTRTESVWRYPTADDVNVTPGTYNAPPTSASHSVDWASPNSVTASSIPTSSMQASTHSVSANQVFSSPKPAPSAATHAMRPDSVRTFSKTPHDDDVLISEPLHSPGFPPKSPQRALSAAAMAANTASAVGSPAVARAANVPLPNRSLAMAAPANIPLPGRTAVMESRKSGELGGPGVPPPNSTLRQHIHSTHRNDLGPTHHTDIDQRRPDTHEPYAALDSEAYLGPQYHDELSRQTMRRASVSKEWQAVPKPREISRERDDQSPVGARPSRPTPVTEAPMEQVSKKAPGLRQGISSRLGSAQQTATQRMPSTNSFRSMASNAQQGIQQRIPSANAVRTTSQRFVPTVKNNMPSGQQMKTVAMKAQSRVASSMPETNKAVKNIAANPGMAVTFTGNLASNVAAGVRNLMPDHLNEEVSIPHIPGAYDSENYTHSDEADSSRSSVSSDSSLYTPLQDYLKKDLPELEPASTSRSSNLGDPPTVLDFENRVVPGGVVKGAHALVGPAVLMENKKTEEELSLRRLRRMSQHENIAVNQLAAEKEPMMAPMKKTMKQQNDDTATKMRELQIAEARRERKQAEDIRERIGKNFIREEHDEFEMAKKVRREADRALQEAKRTKSHQDVNLAHKLEKEYQSSTKQNQQVLKENYRSGLGVTVAQGVMETTKHHSGRLDGVQDGTGPASSPSHIIVPQDFESATYSPEGAMGEGTESENPHSYHQPSNTAPNHPSSTLRPKNQPRRTTGNVITNHIVSPNQKPIEPSNLGIKKSKTIATQPSSQRSSSQRFVIPASQRIATQKSPKIIATQLAEGSHSIRHPAALNVLQHVTCPVEHPAQVGMPTNALELDPVSTYTKAVHHPGDFGTPTQAIPIDPITHVIARDPIHPHTSTQIPTHPQPHHIATAPVSHPLPTPYPTNAIPVGPFPTITAPVNTPVDVSTPTQAVPIDSLSHTLPKDPLHYVDASVQPLNPLAPSPSGEEKDQVLTHSPTDMRPVTSTVDTLTSHELSESRTSPKNMGPVTSSMDTLASPSELSKSQKKKANRKKHKAAKSPQTEQIDNLDVPLLSRDTPSPLSEEARIIMDRAMGSPLPVKQPAGVARPGANTVAGGVRPMSWAKVAAEGDFTAKVDQGDLKLL